MKLFNTDKERVAFLKDLARKEQVIPQAKVAKPKKGKGTYDRKSGKRVDQD